jgi:hypothetical protein
MSRIALVLLVVIGAGGCGNDGGERVTDPCLRFTSCGQCTPIRGCGWCERPGATGICLRDPLECPGPQFTWTWESIACVGGTDGGPPAEAGASNGDGPMCRIPAAANTFAGADAGADAGSTGCQPNEGGNLCNSSQYSLACHGSGVIPPPDVALKCAIVPIPTPMNVNLFCCPCGS